MRKLLAATAACVAVGLAGASAPGVAAATASARLVQVTGDRDTAYLVPVSIGALRDLLFLVDTAATRTVITPAVRDALSLRPEEAKMEEVAGAGGDINAPTYILPALAVGGAHQHDLHVVVLDLGGRRNWMGRTLDGVLGADFLRNYDVLLDGRLHTMELTPRSSRARLHEPGFEDAYTRVPFEVVGGGFLVVPVWVNGHAISAVLDTGSSRSVLNHRAAELAGLLPATGTPIETTGADNTSIAIRRHQLDRLEFAGLLSEHETVSVGDLPIFRQFGLDDRPAIILGAGCLQNRSALISYSDRALYLERPSTSIPLPAARPQRQIPG